MLSGAAYLLLSLLIIAGIGWQLLAEQARQRAVIDRRLGLALSAAPPRADEDTDSGRVDECQAGRVDGDVQAATRDEVDERLAESRRGCEIEFAGDANDTGTRRILL